MLSSRRLNASPSATRVLLSATVLVLAVALFSLPAAAQKYQVTFLTSDISDVGDHTDANLVNPWGLVANASGPWWVSDNGTGLSTLYDGTGTPQSLVVTIPGAMGGNGAPTGIVFNSTSDFKILGTPAHFLFASEDGAITGWYTGTSAQIVVNSSDEGAVYKGLALGSAGGANYLYAADFHNNRIDVFDGTFTAHSFGPNAFVDSTIPSGFAPFNVTNIGSNKLAVTYAKQDADRHDDVAGPGNGYVDIYDTSGNLLKRLQHTIYLNSPWAVVMAPATGFGGWSGYLLIGQFGSGAIAAYNPSTGNMAGLLLNPSVLQLQINGLWGLAFGNGGSAGPTNTLYFTAGYFDEAHGILGTIVALPPTPSPQAQRSSRKDRK